MKTNFKKLAIAGVLVGALTVGGVSTIAFATGNAYQNYKDAALQTIQEQNMTVTSDIMVKQDGTVIISGNAVSQTAGLNQYSSSQMKVNGETVDTESSTIDGSTIRRIGDQYTSTSYAGKNGDWDSRDQFSTSSSSVKLMEMVTDLLVGDVKTYFTGSGNTVSVNLEGAQIPELLNVAASAMVEQGTNKPGRVSSESDIFSDVLQNLTITQSVQVKRISLEAEMSDGYVGDNVITIVLTGKDSAGAVHEMELTCNASLSNIGSTTPQAVDTTGKTVTETAFDNYRYR